MTMQTKENPLTPTAVVTDLGPAPKVDFLSIPVVPDPTWRERVRWAWETLRFGPPVPPYRLA